MMLGGALAIGSAAAAPVPLLAYNVAGDGIAAPLTGQPGDAVRGRQVVANRQVGMCLLCHMAPIPEERFQGNIGPDLRGVGSRLTPAQIRLRVVDAARLNPDTVMPSYYVVAGRNRVGGAWAGRPVLDAGQIEDVVAFLATLRAP
ncbi:sulfur oxidation c-type cytochrome SoxX [Limobrevibacterium gyesilva]|uniref:Sulfur oxidation c-type cytochrome SoxX n=1 Tax=Limobrevibacterium gyesilva TaxID=2991712 RepID=A0AA41YKL1_9PROT|nr:sulfur oxidation c-type cytochrome SoxX [Limobrevibacterium gyesilva]MCW3473917.1 sulfur oxidation c-type cytochrome SoxX [Limobrevibacterium gyesilva]